MTKPVRVEFDGPLALVTIDNPPVNSVSMEVIRAFNDVVDELLLSDARAVLTRAKGDMFCAGADVNVFKDGEYVRSRREIAEGMSLLQRFERLPIPTVVAVNSLCVAAGCEFLLMHDIALAVEGVLIGQIEAQIGTSTLLGGVQRLADRCGIARAKEMVFSGKMYPAETLESWNIVNKVLPAEGFDEAALKYARRLANGPSVAHGITKAALGAWSDSGLAAADRVMLEASPHLLETKDMQAGVSNFLEHGVGALGKTKFEGR